MNRQEVLDSLRELFVARGFEGTSLADVAEASGLSKASLYHHFPDGKTGIGMALVRDAGIRLQQRVMAPLRAPEPAEARLAAMLSGVRDHFADGELGCVLTVFALAPPESALLKPVRERLEEWTGLLATTLEEAGRSRKEARHEARDVVARIQGASLLARALGHPKLFRQVLRRVERDLLSA